MTNKPKAIGTAAETAVVRYLVAHGFGSAERSALHGGEDQGDITGTPGICWEVKGGHAAEGASDLLIADWLAETETERRHRGADVAVLVRKRKGKGAASAAGWWAHLPGWAYLYLAWCGHLGSAVSFHAVRAVYVNAPAVTLRLDEATRLLRRAGYGDPMPSVKS